MNLLTIINAKTSDKSELGEWYKDRLKICVACEFNSENKEYLNFKDKAIVLANIGKPSCLACGCEIAAKASVETEDCGAVKKGMESKWIKLNLKKQSEFIVINKSEEKATISKTIDNSYRLDYNNLKYKSDSAINLYITKKDLKILKLSVKSTCGCTMPESTFNSENEISLKIVYDSNRIGSFNKTVSLTIYEENGRENKLFFNIQGVVTQ